MIDGSVYERVAVVDLTVHGPDGQAETLEFVVDTGFDGTLTLHPSVVAALGLPALSASRAILADGSETVFTTYIAHVSWGNARQEVVVDASEGAHLLGMGLLEGHELLIHDIPDGLVRISPLPATDEISNGGTR